MALLVTVLAIGLVVGGVVGGILVAGWHARLGADALDDEGGRAPR